MATIAYPKIPATAWRTLRLRAANAPSTRFSGATVAAVLNMSSPRSATDNIVGPLRKLGLVAEDGSLTARGNKWRVDASYAEACQEILDEVYPPDLAALTDGSGKPDKQQLTTWMQHQGFGDSNARQMAATYALIAEKTIPEGNSNDSGKTKSKSQVSKPRKADPTPKTTNPTVRADVTEAAPPPPPERPPAGPNVHLDIQIHIPADASADQIEQIFASMAKHLYPR